MKTLTRYIDEKLSIDKNYSIPISYKPKNFSELKEIIDKKYDECCSAGTYYLDCRDIDVSKIKEFTLIYRKRIRGGLFSDFTDVKIIDLRGWKTSKVTHTAQMFWNCVDLEEIKGIEDFDVSNVKNMGSMFEQCFSLKFLDLSNWDFSSVMHINEMFYYCKNLKEIKGIENLNPDEILNKTRRYPESVFGQCKSLIIPDNWKDFYERTK